MTRAESRQPITSQPNFLTGQPVPNSLGGVGPPRVERPLPRRWVPATAIAGLVLGALAYVLLVWRPA